MKRAKKKGPTLDDLLKQNPQLDEEQARGLVEIRRRLREIGGGKRGYQLASPFVQKRVSVNTDAADRTVTLRRPAPAP